MTTASIKLKIGTTARTKTAGIDGALRRKILSGMMISLATLAFLYVFFLGEMVFNIVGRKSLDAQAQTLGNQVSQLELGYLSVSGKIDLNYSHALGFKEISPEYATRKALGSIQIPNNEL